MKAGEGVREKGRTQRIMEAMPSSKQAMGAGGSSTYQVSDFARPCVGAPGLSLCQADANDNKISHVFLPGITVFALCMFA